MIGKIYKNNKTGDDYLYLTTCINATNVNNGQNMIAYVTKDTTHKTIYVREEKEFYEKFTLVEDNK